MKIKSMVLSFLAVAVMCLIPVSGVAAANVPVYSGTATYENSEPIVVSYKDCVGGTYDEYTHNWNVSVAGAGTVQLIMSVTNNSIDNASYTVTASVSPSASTDGTITATWTPSTQVIAKGETVDYTLSIVSTSLTTPQVLNLSTLFTRE